MSRTVYVTFSVRVKYWYKKTAMGIIWLWTLTGTILEHMLACSRTILDQVSLIFKKSFCETPATILEGQFDWYK